MNEFHFLRPLWLWALPLIILLVMGMLHAQRRSRSWSAVCDPELLRFLLADNKAIKRHSIAPWLTGVATFLLIIALAGPSWERLPQPVFRDQSALVIALDMSRSMNAADLKPNRLTRALHKITDILNLRQSGQTALLVYAGEAFTVTPLSDDRDTILALLSGLETSLMPSPGSHAEVAVVAADKLLQQAGVTRGDVLLITDGINGKAIEKPLATLRKHGHQLSILGIGSAVGAPIPSADGGFIKDRKGSIVIPKLDSASLQQWAQRGGGRYAEIRIDDKDIEYLLNESDSHALDQAKEETDLHTDQWLERGPWLILLVIPFAILAFRRGILAILLAVIITPLPESAQAFSWVDLWSRPDQQAMRSMGKGDSEAAAQQFTNPQWKATADYRSGNYEQAAAALEGIDQADALYNRGNALAKGGKIPDAMASYQRALELEPEHEDAKYNLELLEKKQQKKQDKNKDSDEKGDEKQDQDSDQQQQSSQDSESQDESSKQQQEPSESESSEKEQKKPSDQQQSEADEQEQTSPPDEPDDAQSKPDKPAEQEQPKDDSESKQAALPEKSEREQEKDAITEQWLHKIPDDPGGLLRRKFLYQYKQREQRAQPGDQAW